MTDTPITGNQIVEDLPDLKVEGQAKPTHMSLNPSAMKQAQMKLLDSTEHPVKQGRTMSLATRPDTDPMELVERAKKLCKKPIKISW